MSKYHIVAAKALRAICGMSSIFCLPASASPSSVTIAGNLQSEVGCSGDFVPDCSATKMTKSLADGIWRTALAIPAGSYNYFAALNGSFAETYGLHGGTALNAIPLDLSSSQAVTFYFDENSHWVTDNVTSHIAVLAGNFQSELGCSGDFDPACMRSWLQDIDGDGIYTFETALPDGTYDTVVSINESFTEVYGKPGGGNYRFTTSGKPVKFSYDGGTHLLTIDTGTVASAAPEPGTWAMMICGLALVGASIRGRKLAVNIA